MKSLTETSLTKRFTVLNWALCIGFSFAAVSTQAGTDRTNAVEYSAIEAAIDARDAIIDELQTQQIRGTAQRTLNMLVDRGVKALRSEGFTTDADQADSEWNEYFIDFLSRRDLSKLGDHKPLFDWLVKFYRILEIRIGKKAAHAGILGDVYDLNYALPVVFQPKGEWRTNSTKKDTAEYREHFIPMTEIVTYWGTYLACTQVMKSQGMPNGSKKLCLTVAEEVSSAIKLSVAPKISDFVFLRAIGVKTELLITKEDVVYTNADDLARVLGL